MKLSLYFDNSKKCIKSIKHDTKTPIEHDIARLILMENGDTFKAVDKKIVIKMEED